MKTLNNMLASDENQIRRNAIQYARENNYKVTEMYNKANDEMMKIMSDIHSNGKQGNYSLAVNYSIIVETLETWI